jgi:hypothetical protein
MKRLLAAVAAAALLVAPGCVYANIRVPLDEDLSTTRLGAKTGRASNQQVLGLVAWGDAGTQAAAENGGITTINHADLEILNVLWFVYSKETTIVYGD